MYIRNIDDFKEIIAGDSTILREILHPNKEDISIRYSLAHARLKPGTASMRHRLKASEVYYILEGEGRMHIDAETAMVQGGQLVYIPPYATQYIENIGSVDLTFLCIVDPAWKKEDEVIE